MIKKRKIVLFCLLFVFVIFFLLNSVSDPYTVARRNNFVEKDAELIFQNVIDNYHIFVFDSADVYRTVIVKKNVIICTALSSTFYVEKNNDEMKLLSYCTVNDNEGAQLTSVVFQSLDSNAASIKILDHQEEKIEFGEIIGYTWPQIKTPENINATVFSSEQFPLYKLGYETIGGAIDQGRLVWVNI